MESEYGPGVPRRNAGRNGGRLAPHCGGASGGPFPCLSQAGPLGFWSFPRSGGRNLPFPCYACPGTEGRRRHWSQPAASEQVLPRLYSHFVGHHLGAGVRLYDSFCCWLDIRLSSKRRLVHVDGGAPPKRRAPINAQVTRVLLTNRDDQQTYL